MALGLGFSLHLTERTRKATSMNINFSTIASRDTDIFAVSVVARLVRKHGVWHFFSLTGHCGLLFYLLEGAFQSGWKGRWSFKDTKCSSRFRETAHGVMMA